MTRENTQSRFISQFGVLAFDHKWKDVLTIINGKAYGEEYKDAGSYPICGSGGIMGYGEKKMCDHDTIILGRKGNIDRPIYMSEDYWIVDTAFCLCPKTELIHPVYLYYWCKQFDFQKLNKQAVLPSLTRSDLEQIDIQVPEMAEQLAFVAIVQQADKSKFNGFKSRFIEELYSRYPKQKLGEHICVIRGVSYKPSDVRGSNSEASTAIILRSNNITDGEINFDDLVFVVKERVQKEQELHAGDIVMCGSNGSISLVGKAGLLKTNRPNISFGAFCLGIKCKETVLPEYLNTYFNTPVYRAEIESMGNGTNIINIRPNNIINLMIPIPPSDEQKAFVGFVQQADKSKYLN